MPLLIALGFWQLQRADFKSELQSEYDRRHRAKPLTLAEIRNKKMDVFNYYSLQLTGSYDNAHTLLLDNKINHHRVGYDVVTPFLPEDGGPAILINRGWIPINKNRSQFPTIANTASRVTLKGFITLPSSKKFTLGKEIFDGRWPQVTQQIDIKKISDHLGYALLPVVLCLSPEAPTGFVREWAPVVTNPARHTGYAVQWFALALTLLICYLTVSLRKKGN